LITILGIDLAWGSRMPDAISRVDLVDEQVRIGESFYTNGNEALRDVVDAQTQESSRVILAVDAPMICKNEIGVLLRLLTFCQRWAFLIRGI